MAMPALDMEPDSQRPPASDQAQPSSLPPGDEATSGKPPAGAGAAPAKPPAASLISIAVKGKSAAAASKAGDLTRLFELARRQAAAPAETAPTEAPPIEPPPAELAPSAVPSAEFETAPEPMLVAPAPVEPPAADMSPELHDALHLEAAAEPAPAPAPAELPSLADSSIVSEAAIELREPSFETGLPLMMGVAPSGAAETPEAAETSALIEAGATVEPPQPMTLPAAEVVIEAPSPVEPAMALESEPAFEAPEPATFETVPMEDTPIAFSAPAAPDPEPSDEPIVAAPVEAEASVEPAPAAAMEREVPSEPEPVEPPAPVSVVPIAPLPTPVPTPAPAVPAAPKFSDLVDYWRSLRAGDDHPAALAIDRDLVTERWPGSLLIGYTPAAQDPRGELRPARVTRLGTASAETQSAVDAGSYATEWMLEVARAALLNDEPVEELQRLATRTGAVGFRLVALPLGPAKGLADAVLCAMMPNSAAPRFGKRRAWL